MYVLVVVVHVCISGSGACTYVLVVVVHVCISGSGACMY